MIFTVSLQAGVSVANVRYKWIVSGVTGSEQTDGITQPTSSFPLMRIMATPPDDAEEILVYDSTGITNWNLSSIQFGLMT